MEYMPGYQNLTVWKESLSLAKRIVMVADSFPRQHQYEVASQMRRAAVSIMSNLAEGSRKGRKEEAQYVRITLGSAAELESQIILCRELGFANSEIWNELLRTIDRISRQL
ncbi:four helix bundle protein [Candidatus Uhrbacteria bacterium UHB]|jgi:four helix bundle protein|nr:four helix bundle protein [Candidatus Uhrbacteria bacterium UHB]RIL00092.1 MAG: four helix bundle protein [Candidatus Uhrbacteria bacterium]